MSKHLLLDEKMCLNRENAGLSVGGYLIGIQPKRESYLFDFTFFTQMENCLGWYCISKPKTTPTLTHTHVRWNSQCLPHSMHFAQADPFSALPHCFCYLALFHWLWSIQIVLSWLSFASALFSIDIHNLFIHHDACVWQYRIGLYEISKAVNF